MPATALIRARIDPEIKQEASAVLEAVGLTVSDAMRMLLTRIAREKKIPAELFTPNAETITAMRDAIAGRTQKVGSIDDLIADLHEDD